MFYRSLRKKLTYKDTPYDVVMMYYDYVKNWGKKDVVRKKNRSFIWSKQKITKIIFTFLKNQTCYCDFITAYLALKEALHNIAKCIV